MTLAAPLFADGAHQPVLDGLRGVAILLVMMVHLTVMNSETLVDRAFYRIADLGWIGVDLFFVLSGFLITGILYDAKGSPHYFRNFYARRTLRIFPVYYAVVVLSLLLLPAFVTGASPPPQAAWTYWVFLSNFAVAWYQQFPTGMLIVVWSLAIEEQFYLVWAPLVRWLSPARLVRLCTALIVFAYVIRLTLTALDTHPTLLYVLPFARMDALALGGLIAVAVRREGGLAQLERLGRRVGPIAAIIVLAAVVWDNNARWSGAAMQTVGYSCLAAMFGSLLVVALASSPQGVTHRVLMNRALRRIGIYSYALYLIHLPLRALVRDHLFGPAEFPTLFESQLPGQLLFYLVGAAPALCVAALSWRFYERPFLTLKRRFPLADAPHPRTHSPEIAIVA